MMSEPHANDTNEEIDASFCPECGATMDPDSPICPNCGAEFGFYCPECDEEISADATVCPHCGADMDEGIEDETDYVEGQPEPELESGIER